MVQVGRQAAVKDGQGRFTPKWRRWVRKWAHGGRRQLSGVAGRSDFLIANTNGAVSGTGRLGSDGKAAYTQVAALGPGVVVFRESGRFSWATAKSAFLIENTNGAVVLGGGTRAVRPQVHGDSAGLGPEWHFVGAGDYSGNGMAGFSD